MKHKLLGLLAMVTSLVVGGMVLSACQGSGSADTGTVSGKVTNSVTSAAIGGATITTDPAIPKLTIQSKDDGTYTASLPAGNYTITVKAANYADGKSAVPVIGGQTTKKDIALKPTARVAVNAGSPLSGQKIGSTVTLNATVTILDGSSTVQGYQWTQLSGAKAVIDGATTATAKITLANDAAYKAELFKDLGQVVLDRNVVQAINPLSLTTAATATFKVTATTSSGTYSYNVNVAVDLPYSTNGGISDVPLGLNVLLHAKKQAGYSWTLTAPSGSKAALDDATSQNPYFLPDVAGHYVATESKSKATIDVYAGTWADTVTSVDAKGNPQAAGCTACHNGKVAPDVFTAWSQSGHAHKFEKELNTNATYAATCFACHSVGYNKGSAAAGPAINNGLDDTPDFTAFLNAGLLDNISPTNYTTMIAKFPAAASLTGIQCQNCHGPNDGTGLHPATAIDKTVPEWVAQPQRVSLSSDVCAQCHGSPTHHGRFQEWQLSAHSNVQVALDESTNASCARCHTAQGFLTYLQQPDKTLALQGKNGNMTAAELQAIGLTPDAVQPQTCVVCHDPHKLGTETLIGTDAVLRVDGSTAMLPAGFQAVDVGHGALCITCHNTRNGLHNDSVGVPTSYQAPHTPGQGDVLMGENAYFVATGGAARSKHSFIENTCVTCHMELTPPPTQFSIPGDNSTNHSFSASLSICSKCHGDFNGGTLQDAVESKLTDLGTAMVNYFTKKLGSNVTVLDYSYDNKADAVVLSKSSISSVSAVEVHGQQGFIFNLTSPVTISYKATDGSTKTVSTSKLQAQLGDITTDGKTPVIAASDPLVRAGWNYYLVEGDGSKGVHNPTFVQNTLQGAMNALK